MPTNNHFLVPTDFTSVADCALQHAISVAKTVNGHVTLLHVIGKEAERKTAQTKLAEIASKASAESGVAIESVVKEGNIFDDIGGVAETLGAKLIFMGTHGVKGMQHITGSYAVKVFTNSNVPFVVVQERGIRGGYKNIVLPMDLTKESKQKLDLTIKMAEYFGAKIHIFSQHETDDFIKKSIMLNTNYAKNELQKKGVPFVIQEAKESGHFVKQLLDYAKNNDADLIAIVNSQERGVHELLHGTDERATITNEAQIPVLVVNPAHVTNAKIAYFISGQ